MSGAGRFERVTRNVFLVGGAELSDSRDCLVYLVDVGDLVLIDSGCGPGWREIRDNIVAAGKDPGKIHTLVLTHGHIDHTGAASKVVAETGCRVVAHEADAGVIEAGDSKRSAADWYGVHVEPIRIDHRVAGDEETVTFAKGALRLIHAPGHTPGSMVVLLEARGKRVLFGQDIHGPFLAEFGSDVGQWRESMQKVLALRADILCEGHFGIFRGKREVRKFIEGHLAAHK
jgi:glyoxylase-like metal-dependent hydrolase (beta-lactamase superfamily II)